MFCGMAGIVSWPTAGLLSTGGSMFIGWMEMFPDGNEWCLMLGTLDNGEFVQLTAPAIGENITSVEIIAIAHTKIFMNQTFLSKKILLMGIPVSRILCQEHYLYAKDYTKSI